MKLSLKSDREIKTRKKKKRIQITKIRNQWRTLPLTLHKDKVLYENTLQANLDERTYSIKYKIT
jgi:hypothetical protein